MRLQESPEGADYLFQSFQNSLLIIFWGNALDGCQGFTPVALLNTDMDVVLYHKISIDIRYMVCWG